MFISASNHGLLLLITKGVIFSVYERRYFQLERPCKGHHLVTEGYTGLSCLCQVGY